jgi:hypothetical protein
MTPENIVDVPAPQNFFSRLIGVYFSPGETFKEIGLAPKIVMPLIVLALVGALVGIVMAQRLDTVKIASMGIEKAVADGKMTPEQAAPQLEAMRKNETLIKASFPLFGILGSLITVFAVAGVFKLVSLILGTENTFMPILAVTLYAFLAISIISSVVFVVILFLKSPDEIDIQNPIGSNLGSLLTLFLSKESVPKFILAFANWIDVFSIWRLSLLAIGYAAVSRRLKTASAFTTLVVLYLGAALIAATWATLFG